MDDALREVVESRQPALALRAVLLRALQSGAAAPGVAAAGVAVFEALWHTLPPFEDDGIAAAAAELYQRLDETDAARLLDGMAAQLQRLEAGGRPAIPDMIDPRAARILADAQPAALLLHTLEGLEAEQDWPGSALVFETVWAHSAPLVEFWVYYRMAQVYTALARPRAAALMAGIAAQIEPGTPVSDLPYRFVLGYLRDSRQLRAAALLLRRRAALCPQPPLLPPDEAAALLASAGALPHAPPPFGRTDRPLLPASVRPPMRWRSYGGEVPCLDELRRPMAREAIGMTELRDAEVLLDRGAVAVFGADGQAHIDLSLRDYPGMVRRSLAAARRAGHAIEELSLDAAVLIADEFSGPNLCHFLCDQATRLALYRQAGLEIEALAAITPDIRAGYQLVAGSQLGLRAQVASVRRARVAVGQLWVSSNCRGLRHPAHWGSDWAVQAVRAGFDLQPRGQRRLLISRADATVRRIANEAEVAAVLAPFGFEVIVPGRLSFAEQVAAFRDATHVVGPHGAGLANILFCAPGTQVLEVFPPLYGTWAYAMIAPPLGLDYAAMLARDGESDDPMYNDPTLPQERRNQHAGRDMRVDPDQLIHWLLDSGA